MEGGMKKILITITMISVFMVPALLAQGKGITPIVPGSDKLKITGVMGFMQTKYLGMVIKLNCMGRPVLNANVWLNNWPLENRGGGEFRVTVDKYTARVGDKLELAVELPRERLLLVKPPFEGRQVLASLVIDNIIEWVFPMPGQVIDLSSYSMGFISCRWNFTGTPVRVFFELFNTADPDRIIFSRTIEAEAVNVPLSVVTPGNEYRMTVDDDSTGSPPLGAFKMSKLAAPGSSLVYYFVAECTFSTSAAKK
jgi:hypothetical protein